MVVFISFLKELNKLKILKIINKKESRAELLTIVENEYDVVP